MEFKGRVFEKYSLIPLEGVHVQMMGKANGVWTDSEGVFVWDPATLSLGPQIISISKKGYKVINLTITIKEGTSVNLNPLYLDVDIQDSEEHIGLIQLDAEDLVDDGYALQQPPGLLEASRDVFQRATAFDFSAAYFRPRSLDSKYSKLYLNGLLMNSPIDGRVSWSAWGGMNTMLRNNQQYRNWEGTTGGYGGIGGTQQITLRSSRYRQGGGLSYAMANRSYGMRIMASYSNGRSRNGWSYSVLLSRRFGNEGYVEGTLYEANSIFSAAEKVFANESSLSLSAFYTPNSRGRSSALTDEVWKLKGPTYNPNWGFQEGSKRSSNQKTIRRPHIILGYNRKLGTKADWGTHLLYNFGFEGTTRLDNRGVRNPFPHYYQRLPSYFLRNPTPSVYDFQQAYWAKEALLEDGQLDWSSLYEANQQAISGGAIYAVQENRQSISDFQVVSTLGCTTGAGLQWVGGLRYRRFFSENYARIQDLLGAQYLLDIDSFYDGGEVGFEQSDIQTPNREVKVGDIYQYHYGVKAQHLGAFGHLAFQLGKPKITISGKLDWVSYQREGYFNNGYFQETGRSLGNSKSLPFVSYGIKAGMHHAFSGKHRILLNSVIGIDAPNASQCFASIRQNNDLVSGISVVKHQGVDIAYIFRSRRIQARFQGYFLQLQNATDIGFYYTQNAIGVEGNNAFVQEIVQGIDKRHWGLETGINWKPTSSLVFKFVGSFGQAYYNSNPSLYLSGDDFDYDTTDGLVEGNDLLERGKRRVALENVHLAQGPQQAYQLGLEYRDPEYWWLSLSVNRFSHAYVDVSFLRRSDDFALDSDGQPLAQYDPAVARDLLRQERLPSYYLVHAVGGKSWRIKRYYISIFASVNNLLNQAFRTGGFEDSRLAGYKQQVEERNRGGGPLFGTRYFQGTGTTYFVNLSLRF